MSGVVLWCPGVRNQTNIKKIQSENLSSLIHRLNLQLIFFYFNIIKIHHYMVNLIVMLFLLISSLFLFLLLLLLLLFFRTEKFFCGISETTGRIVLKFEYVIENSSTHAGKEFSYCRTNGLADKALGKIIFLNFEGLLQEFCWLDCFQTLNVSYLGHVVLVCFEKTPKS